MGLREVNVSITLEQSFEPRLGLEISPALISFAEMLTLPMPAMQSLIEEELGCNDALERLDADVDCPICRGAWRSRCPVCSVPASRSRATLRSQHQDPLQDVPAAETDTEALLRAVRLEARVDEAPIVEYVVESLDRHGLLDRSCQQLAEELGVDEASVARVVAIIRRTGPPGVGATSATECLLLQLDALCLEQDEAALVRAVIDGYLPALARGRFTSVAASLGVPPAEVRQVLELIRLRLRPHPAFNGSARELVSGLVPDVVVRPHDEIDGEFMVELVEPAFTRLGVRAHRGRHDRGTSVSEARSFVAQLRDRWETLRRVVECAVDHQRRFLVDGPASLKPLTRAEVSLELGLHESTVSRTVADKYALLPDRSIAPLSCFFSASGAVDEELRRLLESADGPVSDGRLAQLLSDAGYPIARRTVAKHRARLGISSMSLR